MVSAFQVGASRILGAAIYAPPRGPTYGDPRKLTSAMLATLTEEVVIGRSGLRFIAGDLNLESTALEAFAHWRSLGWEECQTFALRHFNRQPTFTCKGSTSPDQIWLSPELQQFVQAVDSSDEIFSDHAALQVSLSVCPAQCFIILGHYQLCFLGVM